VACLLRARSAGAATASLMGCEAVAASPLSMWEQQLKQPIPALKPLKLKLGHHTTPTIVSPPCVLCPSIPRSLISPSPQCPGPFAL
jgi:hypothetical protein